MARRVFLTGFYVLLKVPDEPRVTAVLNPSAVKMLAASDTSFGHIQNRRQGEESEDKNEAKR
jgi:hypothetical protein